MKGKEILMDKKITCPYCDSDEVKEHPCLYGERPVAPEVNHDNSIKKYEIYRCLKCGREFD